MYKYRILDKSKDLNDNDVYILCNVFNAKYAIEATIKRLKTHIKKREISNIIYVGDANKIVMFADIFHAAGDFYTCNTKNSMIYVIEAVKPSSNQNKKYLKFFTAQGVNITCQIYQVIGRNADFEFDEDNITLIVKTKGLNKPIAYFVESTIYSFNEELKQVPFEEDYLLKNYIFLN